MPEPITTAPRDGSSIIIGDDASGTRDVARWSSEAGRWVDENGRPSKITPSHWLPMPGETCSLREQEAGGGPWLRTNGFFFSSGARTAPRQRRLEARAAPGQGERRSWTRPGFAILTVASLVMVSSAASYFHDETATLLTDYPAHTFRVENQLASAALQQSNASQSQPQFRADQASTETPAERDRQAQRSAIRQLTSSGQSTRGEQRSPSLANELIEARRRSVDGLRLQLQTEAATAKQSLDAKREKVAPLELQARAARPELTASDERRYRALDHEPARSATLAGELAARRSEIEKQPASAGKAGVEAVRQRQAVEGTVAEVRQFLQEEREKAAAPVKDEDALRKQTAMGEQQRRSLDEERARSAALAGDLAATLSEMEKQVALVRRVGEETMRHQQAVEGTVAELRQSAQQKREKAAALANDADAPRKQTASDEQQRRSLDEERARSAALAGELAAMRSEMEKQVASARNAGEEAARQQQAMEGTVAELRRSLQEEREKATALSKDADALRKQTASDEQQRRSLDEERARSAALAGELAAMRSEMEKQAASARNAGEEAARQRQAVEGTVAELRRSLQQEHEKAVALATDADALRKQTASDEQQRRSLDEERARSTALAGELAAMRSEMEKQAASAHNAGEEAVRQQQAVEGTVVELRQSLQQEREKAAALDKVANAARQAMIADTEKNRRALDEMRARNAALASELAATLSGIEKQAALSRNDGEEAVRQRQAMEDTVAELRQSLAREKAVALAKDADAVRKQTVSDEQHRRSLDEERVRSTTLASELAATRREMEKQATLSRKTRDQLAPQRLDAERTSVERQQPVKHEREASELMPRDLRASPMTMDGNLTARLAAGAQNIPAAQAANAPVPAPPAAAADAQDNAEATRLMARASALLAQGNIGAARIVLERAVEIGSAQASFMLAETYDPAILSAWGTYGTRGEAAKARELYARAQSGGIREAKARLETLRQAKR